MEVESRYIRSLLQSARTGNNAALEQLFEMNLDRIYTVSHRLTGNQQDAETLASTTLVEAWRQLDKIRTDVPFNLWLDSLNVHLALQYSIESKDTKKKWGILKRKKIEVKEPDPKLSELDIEICKLPKLERTVFVLNKIENYTHDELSVMMDISLNQIKEKLEDAESLLLKAESIHTYEVLTKKVAELPKKIKANQRIQKDALTEINEIKLKERIDSEEEEKKEVTEEFDDVTESRELKPAKLKTRKGSGIELPSIDLPTITPGFTKKIGWVLTTIAIGIAAYLIIEGSLKDWEANLQSGTVTLGGHQLTGSSGFSGDETLKTAENSTAEIIIPAVGRILIESQSELKRLNEKNSAELFHGKINVDCSDAEEFFTLLIPASIISNYYLGSVYTVNVKTDKSGQIFVNKGWIKVVYKDKETIAAPNFYIDFDATFGISMPYAKNSDIEFINAVREFLYTKSEIHVERIVSLATQLNALSLWNLLSFISPAKRLLVYRKLNYLVPHPPAITNEDVLNLNSEILQIWLKEIELNM
jgi:RNA polymerase sigma-70 factor (ECF subfamily)